MAKNKNATPEKVDAESWRPRFVFDLFDPSANARKFSELVKDYKTWADQQPVADDFPEWLVHGNWLTVTPEIAEEMIKRNASNRKVSFAHVVYLARQMLANDWKPTGQGIIFTPDGRMVEGQHREFACLLSGASFSTLIVIQPENIKDGFAYLDNGKVRSNSDAVYTSGHDGQSTPMTVISGIAMDYEERPLLDERHHQGEADAA